MKRVTALLIAAMVLLLPWGTAHAAVEPVHIDVTVKYRDAVIGEYTAETVGGSASVMADGTLVSVQGAPEQAVTLVVVPIPSAEAAAHRWFAARTAAVGAPLAVYDIYFLDAAGTRISAAGAAVTVGVSADGEELHVCTVATGGAVTELAAAVSDGGVSFTTGAGTYHVVLRTVTDQSIRVRVDGFQADDIPDDLMAVGMDSVEKVDARLVTSIQLVNDSLDAENTTLYEAELMYSEDGGLTWQAADEEHFPENGLLPVSLPVPEGIDPATHDFTVVHMFSSNAFGKTAGDVEYPEVTERTDVHGNHYLDFYVTGLSPVMVGWTETPVEQHQFTDRPSSVKAADATCTEPARYYVQCEHCDVVSAELTVAVGGPLGHAYDSGTVTLTATCVREGVKTYVCTRDASHTYTEPIPKNAHHYADGVCTVCGKKQSVPATGDTAGTTAVILTGVMLTSLLVSCKMLGVLKKRTCRK